MVGRNADLISVAGPLWVDGRPMLDLTYGEKAGFWKRPRWRPPTLTTNDRKTGTFAQGHEDFRATSWDAESWTSILFDPPYVAMGGRKTSTLAAKGSDLVARFGMLDAPRTPELLHLDLMVPGLEECWRILAPGGRVLVKCMDYVTGGDKKLAGSLWTPTAADRIGFEVVDYLVLVKRGLGPQPLKGRRQEHAHAQHSLLWCFEKTAKRRRRPRTCREPQRAS